MFGVMTEIEYRWVYRMGFGWVERPVVTVEDEQTDERESARAA